MRFYPRKRNISLQSEQIGGIDMFQGFSQQTNDFLWGIRFNNERSWFEAVSYTHLDVYKRQAGPRYEGSPGQGPL